MAVHADHPQSPDLPDRPTDLHSQHLLIGTLQADLLLLPCRPAGKDDAAF